MRVIEKLHICLNINTDTDPSLWQTLILIAIKEPSNLNEGATSFLQLRGEIQMV